MMMLLADFLTRFTSPILLAVLVAYCPHPTDDHLMSLYKYLQQLKLAAVTISETTSTK
jgi:hypothetical protein